MYQMVFRFQKELKDILQKEAKCRGQTLTGIMRQILWEWSKKQQ